MKLRALKCPECRANLEIEEDRTMCYCQYCGCKIILDDEKQETTINKNINVTKSITHNKRHIDDADVIRAKSEATKDSRKFWGSLVSLGILLLMAIAGFIWLNPSTEQSEGEISAGYYGDLIGKNYETVEAHFEAAGFSNIELIDLNDSGILFWKNDKVETISVGGDTSFDSLDWFLPDTKVVISYH